MRPEPHPSALGPSDLSRLSSLEGAPIEAVPVELDPFAAWGSLGVVGALTLAVLGLAALGRRRLRLAAWLRDRRAVAADHPLHRELDALRVRVGITRRVRLTSTDALASPVALGVLRPEICVPERALDGLAPDACTAMLAHELAHLARRDPLWLDLANTLRALFPWQPLLAVAARRMRTLAERRCDALAARIAGPVAVAECLVEVGSWLRADRAGVGREVPAMAVERGGLRDRVERLLGDSWRERRAPRPVATAVVTLGATALFSIALPGASVAEGSVDSDYATAESSPRSAGPKAGGAFARPPAGSELSALTELLELYDAERAVLGIELARLRELARVRRPDAAVSAMLAVIDGRLRNLDRLRAQVADRARALASAPAAALPAAAPSDPVTKR